MILTIPEGGNLRIQNSMTIVIPYGKSITIEGPLNFRGPLEINFEQNIIVSYKY